MSTDPLYKKLFAEALRIRLVEERIIELYPSDKIQSPVHLSIGQEAVAVGVCQPLTLEDLVFGTYRSHAFYLAKGGDLKAFFAELYGKKTGCCEGKGGSMHLAAPEVGYMGSSAVVASTISHALGAALAARHFKRNHLSIAVFGDGATEEGVYHECLNYAALTKLPVLFICENNELAVHSKLPQRQAYKIIEQVKPYGIETFQIKEGYDFVKVQKEFSRIYQDLRRNPRPYFVEIATFRYKEHVGPGDDFNVGYRSKAEYDAWCKKDPLTHDTALVKELTPAILKEIDAAVDFAEKSPWPTEADLVTDVY